MSDRITSFACSYPKHVLIVTFILVVLLLPLVFGLQVENKRGAFSLPPEDPVAAVVDKYKTMFGYTEPLYILIETDSVFDTALISRLHCFVEAVRDVPGVNSVRSMFDAKRAVWFSTLNAYRPKLLPLFDAAGNSTISVDELEAEFAAMPVLNRTVVSSDRGFQAVVVDLAGLQEGIHSAEKRAGTVDAILALLTPISQRYRVSVAGQPMIDRALQQTLHRNLRLFVPLSVLLTALFMTVVFRHWRPVLLIGLLATVGLILTLGIMSILGSTLSLTTIMIIPLSVTMTAAYSMHYLEFFVHHHEEYASRDQLMNRTLHTVFRPSLLCGLTTAAGFLALCASDLWVTRTFGLYMGVGVACSMFAANVLLPALLVLSPVGAFCRTVVLTRISALGRAIGTACFRRYQVVTLVAGSVLLLAIVGLTQLHVETNILRYFGRSAQLTADFNRIDRMISGTLPVDVVVTVPSDSLSTTAAAVIRFRDSLEAIPGFASSNSVFDFLQLMEDAKPAAASPIRFPFSLKNNWYRQSLWSFLNESTDLRDYYQTDGTNASIRIAGRLKTQGSQGLAAVLDSIRAAAATLIPHLTMELAGPVPLFVRMQEYVVETQITSLAISFVVVAVLFAMISRSWRSAVSAIVANSLAIVIILGVMGFSGIPIDVTTVMIAAVAIAIAADDTIHFLYRYKIERAQETPRSVAVSSVFSVIGSPVIITSMFLTLGFAVLGLSDFVPISYFGLLTGLIIILALAADLMVVPALIRLLAGNEPS
jgi:predicted RND superfamily exporter protein